MVDFAVGGWSVFRALSVDELHERDIAVQFAFFPPRPPASLILLQTIRSWFKPAIPFLSWKSKFPHLIAGLRIRTIRPSEQVD